MTRRQKRKKRRGGEPGASKKTQSGGLPVDSRLVKLLETSLTLPGVVIFDLPDGRTALTTDAWLLAAEILDHARSLGGEPRAHLDRALAHIEQRGRG